MSHARTGCPLPLGVDLRTMACTRHRRSWAAAVPFTSGTREPARGPEVAVYRTTSRRPVQPRINRKTLELALERARRLC